MALLAESQTRTLLVLYVLALFFTGIAYLAILPLFEGFDENAHYSSVRQIADTRTLPLYGTSFLDEEVTNYQGPVPFSSLDPPFDASLVYSKFFAHPEFVRQYVVTYRQSAPPISYLPSQELNWQAQHPPLYYMLLAPLEKSLEQFPLVTRMLLLRLVSFLLALAGVTLGFLSISRPNIPLRQNPAILGFLLYPLILPMFFPEFTRVGNDALCLFLVGLTALLFSKQQRREQSAGLPLAIGVTLGIGLLTKAFFLPITAAVSLVFLLQIFRGTPHEPTCRWRNLFLVVLPAIVIGGGWYVYKFAVFGDLTGSDDSIRLAQQGGLLLNLTKHFSPYGFIRGLVVTFVSYSWAGTWSLTRLPPFLHVPLLGLTVWVFAAFGLKLKRTPITDAAWLPVWLFCAFGVGLSYHVLLSVAINGNGNTPGWYLHILMPWVAPAIGLGVCSLLENPRAKRVLTGLVVYAACFQIVAFWAQFALFTGCATKGPDKYYAFAGKAFCIDETSLLIGRLAVIGWPHLAATGLAGSVICTIAIVRTWNNAGRISETSVEGP